MTVKQFFKLSFCDRTEFKALVTQDKVKSYRFSFSESVSKSLSTTSIIMLSWSLALLFFGLWSLPSVKCGGSFFGSL